MNEPSAARRPRRKRSSSGAAATTEPQTPESTPDEADEIVADQPQRPVGKRSRSKAGAAPAESVASSVDGPERREATSAAASPAAAPDGSDPDLPWWARRSPVANGESSTIRPGPGTPANGSGPWGARADAGSVRSGGSPRAEAVTFGSLPESRGAVAGGPRGRVAVAPPTAPAETGQACPLCGRERTGAFRYCRACGYDFEPHPAPLPIRSGSLTYGVMDGRKTAGRWVAPIDDEPGARPTFTLDQRKSRRPRPSALSPRREVEPRSINTTIFVLIGIGLALGAICALLVTLLH